MAKLEDILKKKGYSDADLQGMSTLLADAKFRGALEEEFGVLESDRKKFEDENLKWAQWHKDQALPTIQSAMDKEAAARAEAASLKERLKVAQEQGFAKLEDDKVVDDKTKITPSSEVFDPKKYNLVTQDDVQRFAMLEGDAIALAQDLAAEHQALGLGRLNFRELRKKALEAKVPVDKFWEQEFKVPEKRAEQEAKRKLDEENKIRADERSKVAAEFANPALRPGVPSRSPFLPPAKDKDGKQPWENANARQAQRLQKATESVLKTQLQ